MSMLQDNSRITHETSAKYETSTDGTPANALFTRGDAAIWKSAYDEMLRWRSSSSPFEPEDQPDQAILDTAIDYAVDQIQANGPAPSSIIPSGNGRIAMEWNDAELTVVVEFVDSGTAIRTLFADNRLIRKELLMRNPKSRKLELQGNSG